MPPGLRPDTVGVIKFFFSLGWKNKQHDANVIKIDELSIFSDTCCNLIDAFCFDELQIDRSREVI